MILIYSLIMWVIFSYCLVYFTKPFLEMKYHFLKSLFISLIIHIPYAIIACYGIYLSYYSPSRLILLTSVGFISMVILYVSRQIYLYYFSDFDFKSGVIFQLVILFMGIIRMGVEDMVMYIGGIFYQSKELLYISLIYKIISLFLLYYFSAILYQKVNIIFFKTKTILLFVLEFFLLSALAGFESLFVNAIVFIGVIIVLYILLREIDHDYQLKIYREAIENQSQKISSMIEKQNHRNEVLAKMRHDEKNHLLTLRLLYQSNPQEAKEYLQQWQKEIESKINENLY